MGSCHFSPEDGIHLAMESLRSDCSRGDPRSMVPVRLAGAEVTEGFCTKLAGLS
jgi:hypothetical protein